MVIGIGVDATVYTHCIPEQMFYVMFMQTISPRMALVFVFALTGWLVVGCASSTADWNNRIGKYTLNQATVEFGKPSEIKTLPDGTTSVEWLRRIGTPISGGVGMETGPRAGGVDQPNAFTLPAQNEYLHLTFDAGGTLLKWERLYR
jgi:hypothetical protein